MSCHSGYQATAAVAAAVNQGHYFASLIAVDVHWGGYFAEPLTAAAGVVAAEADFEGYSAGSVISAAAAAAAVCPQHCLVVQLTDFAAYWCH